MWCLLPPPLLLSAVPDVEVKGESAHYFLLVQGSDDAGCETCRVRMLHSDSQINGAAAMATVSGLLGEKSLSSLGILCCFVCRCVYVHVCFGVIFIYLLVESQHQVLDPWSKLRHLFLCFSVWKISTIKSIRAIFLAPIDPLKYSQLSLVYISNEENLKMWQFSKKVFCLILFLIS